MRPSGRRNGVDMKTKGFLHGLIVSTMFFSVFLSIPAFAQSTADLDQRLRTVEEYLEKLPPSMTTYASSLEESINNYTKNLETGLNKYSERLERNIETKLLGINEKTIELDVRNQEYKKIDTTTGQFLISVVSAEPVKGGYKLALQIGNPNYANFRDFELRIVWGKAWNQGSSMTYQQWRDSLTGAVYNFKGDLLKGMWNPVEVELIPATAEDLAYIECEMGVAAIELETR